MDELDQSADYYIAPSFDFGAALSQGLNLPGGKRYLLRVAAWTSLILMLLYVLFGWPIVKAFVALFDSALAMDVNLDAEDPTPEMMAELMGPFFGSIGLIFLLVIAQYALFAVAETAIYRNLLKGEDKGIFPLRLGADEWRVIGTRFIVGLVVSGLILVAYFGMTILGFISIAVAAATESGAALVIGGIIAALAAIVAIGICVWLAVRLAPSAAYNVRNQRFDPLASFHPMTGQVWPAIGAYLIIYIVGYTVTSIIFTLVLMILIGATGLLTDFLPMLDEPTTTGVEAFANLASPGFIICAALTVFVLLFVSLLWYGMIWSLWGYFAKSDMAQTTAPVRAKY